MDKRIIKQWDKNKSLLEHYFKNHPMSFYSEYKEIFKLVIKYILNDDSYDSLNLSENFMIIDDGNYKGTQLFIAHKDVYQPEPIDYFVSNSYYGSCSGCDTIMGITCYDDGTPTKKQVDGFMQIALGLIQKMKCLDVMEEHNNE